MTKLIQLEGRNLMIEALRSKRKFRVIYLDKGTKPDTKINKIRKLAKKSDTKVIYKDRKKLDRISKTNAHQGVIGIAFPKRQPKLLSIIKANQEGGRSSFFVIVDELTFEQNLGAISRTAYAAGVDAVIVPNKGVSGESAVVAHVSAGAVEHIPIVKESIFSVVKKLQENGIKVLGAEMNVGKKYFEADMTGSIALLLGGEDRGLSSKLQEACDELVHIPMSVDFSSLNVSVAAGILIYEKVRQDSMKLN